MSNPFSQEGSKADNENNFSMTEEIRLAIADAGLEDDPAIQQMIESGFVAPNGTEWDPIEFIEQRKALVEAGEAGASATEIDPSALVQHSMVPEEEPRAELK